MYIDLFTFLLFFFRRFASIMAKMHSVIPNDVKPLTKDRNIMVTFTKLSLKFLREIKNHNGLKR